MPHDTIDFATRIRQRGHRLTPQRQMILDAVCEGEGHTTIDQIYQRLQVRAPAVNRSTVYRALEFLQEMQLVVAAEIGGHTVYEIARGRPHHHLVCDGCGHEFEIAQDELAPAFAAIERQHGFQIDADHLVLTGLCPDCRQHGSG